MTSLVTRCPACSTLFKVVPDQLRISEGWVRCGQCDEVFDAQAHMQPHFVAAPDAPSGNEAATQSADADALANAPSTAHEAALVRAESASSADEEPTLGAHAGEGLVAAHDALPNEPHSMWTDAPVGVVELRPESDIPLFGHQVPPLYPDEVAADHDVEVLAPPSSVMGGAEAKADDRLHSQASFLKRSSRKHMGKRQRWIYKLTLPVLALILVLQIVVQQRDRIAATEPALATVLNAVCRPLGCQVEPLRQIESIVIESSSFIKVKADVYRLTFSIKNTALVPLALPFAELALTDLRDQSVLRRVLAPGEYGAYVPTLKPGEDLTMVVPVAVRTAGTTSDKVTGYRLLVFYP